jgi:hypothetical protein
MFSQPLSSVGLAGLDKQEEWGTASFFDLPRRYPCAITTTAGAISSELQAPLPRGTTAKEETVMDLSRFALYPHQAAGVEFLARRGRAILGDDMGLGNTR